MAAAIAPHATARRRAPIACLATAIALLAIVPQHAHAAGLEGIPSFTHVFVLILENENASSTWGSTSVAHYLNSLVPQGVFDEGYYATGHASLDNYIAMTSGQPDQPLTGSDCLAVNLWTCVQPQSLMAGGRNIRDQLESAGISWTGYMDGMPSACFHADYGRTAPPSDPYQGDSQQPPAKDYADRHNPFIYYPDIVETGARCRAHVRPFTDLASDIATNAVPRFGFITPDSCHDGHDSVCSDGQPGGLVSADKWLSQNLPPLLSYLSTHDGLLIVTTDENGFVDSSGDAGCCSGGGAR